MKRSPAALPSSRPQTPLPWRSRCAALPPPPPPGAHSCRRPPRPRRGGSRGGRPPAGGATATTATADSARATTTSPSSSARRTSRMDVSALSSPIRTCYRLHPLVGRCRVSVFIISPRLYLISRTCHPRTTMYYFSL